MVANSCLLGAMFIVGLTGGIATGKSTVSSLLKDLGCPVVDADHIAREVVEPHRPAWKAIVKNFGSDILLSNEEIDREKLGKIIFGDDAKRHVLQNLYPNIVLLLKVFLKFFVGEKFVILDLPLMFETGIALYLMKEVVVVYCDKDTQLKRLMERNNFTQNDAEQRINAQISLDEKCRRASYIIDNSSNRENTETQVKRLYEKLNKSYAYLPVRGFAFLLLGLILYFFSFLVSKILVG
ncbi:hypothetical protein pdam_00019020 [Pocillopora damicornis]|uniref:Dephospho-CoA kinase domain-containing protein n=1 Tax=Pocillopora damicornis TaxID=46731 RepID=A0A3M6V1D0_POCDA|nr:hypothetical protein pdam_00019020 [Pocillopora damicornis]